MPAKNNQKRKQNGRKKRARPRAPIARPQFMRPRLSPVDAHIAATTIARLTHASHPITIGTGLYDNNASGPSMVFSKTVRRSVVSAGVLHDYVVVYPNPSNNIADVAIRQGTSTRTPNEVVAAPDAASIGVGSLFADTAFIDGILEWRLAGCEIIITPTSNRLNCSGLISYNVNVESSDIGPVAIDTTLAADRRTRLVPKRPGQPVQITYLSQAGDSSSYVTAGSTTLEHIVIRIDNDSGVAAQYLVEYVAHFEVVGTLVSAHATHKPINAPLVQAIRHGVHAHHHDQGSNHLSGPQRADAVAQRTMGMSFGQLLKAAESYGSRALTVGSSALNVLGTVGSMARGASSVVEGAAMRYGLPAAARAIPYAALMM